jgi:hypothetical protein
VKKSRIQRRLSIVSAYAISTLLGGAFLVCGFVALLLGRRLYGPVERVPGGVLAGLGMPVLNRRDRWSGHHL